MIRRKEKISASFFLTLLATPILFALYFFFANLHAEQEMKERLEKEALQTITIAQQKIQWIKSGKECRINGRMFDVHSMEISGNNVVLHGLFDEEENQLQTRAAALIHQEQDNNNNTRNGVALVWMNLLYQQNTTTGLLLNIPENLATVPPSAYCNHYHSLPVSIHTPPPKITGIVLIAG
jgi:hypothetical protein